MTGEERPRVSTNTAGTRLATRLSFFVAGLTLACWAPLVPYAKARVGAADGELGLLLLCLGIGSMGAMPVTGALAGKWGSKPVILAGGIGLVLFLPALAIADSQFLLAVALLGFGASLGTIDVAVNIHGVEVERDSGKPLISGFHAQFSIGGFAGAGGMTVLLANGVSPVIASSIASAASLLALLIAAPRLLRVKGEPSPFILPRGVVLLLALMAAATFLVEGAILDWSALLISGAGLVEVSRGGLGYMIFAIAMAVGRLTGDYLVNVLGNFRVLFWGGLLTVAGFVVLLTVPVGWIAMGGFLLIGLGSSNIVPVLISLAGKQDAMPAPLAIAAITTLGYAGILVGPAFIGFFSGVTSLHVAFWFLAMLMVFVPLSAGRATRI